MSKKKRKSAKPFSTGDRVIWFRDGEPVAAWIPSERWHPCRTRHQVRVTRHEKDAVDGRGQLVNQRHVWPWDDALWAACSEWSERRANLMADLKVLAKGQIPKGYLEEFAPTLWGK